MASLRFGVARLFFGCFCGGSGLGRRTALMSPDGLRPSPPLLRFALHPNSDLDSRWRAHRGCRACRVFSVWQSQGLVSTRRRHSQRGERLAALSSSVAGRYRGTSWRYAARLPRDGDRGVPELPILFYLFMHTDVCCTELISKNFWRCHATLFNDCVQCYPPFCGIYLS